MMDAIQLSNKLQNSGLERASVDIIAQAIEERNKELVTKTDLDGTIKSVKELLYLLTVVVAAGFGYIINSINNNSDLLNTIISKLS